MMQAIADEHQPRAGFAVALWRHFAHPGFATRVYRRGIDH